MNTTADRISPAARLREGLEAINEELARENLKPERREELNAQRQGILDTLQTMERRT